MYQKLRWTSSILFSLPKNAKIIDVGGGDSKLVDYLIKEGYEDITVLDISEKALEKAKARLGDAAKKVKWIVSDIIDFVPTEHYTIWHDRATFHFLPLQRKLKNTWIRQGKLLMAI